MCLDSFEQVYSCGDMATQALSRLIRGQVVLCEVYGVEFYGRYLGECWVEQISINRWLVVNGYAVAYRKHSKAYIPEEEEAREEKRGIWVGAFIMPEEWRKRHPR